jgi:hypothetical protein
VNQPAASLITDAYPGTRCEGLRRRCPTPALYAIHVGDDTVYPVCGEHLRALFREMHDE